MAISQTGVISEMVFSGATPAAQDITVEADCKQLRIYCTCYRAGGAPLNACSVGGNPTTEAVGKPQPSDDFSGIWIRYIDAPPTGTVAIQPVFGASPTEGPLFFVEQITAAGTIQVIDADVDSDTGAATSSASSSSNTGDYVRAIGQSFGDAPTINGVSVADYDNVSEFGSLFSLTAGASSTTATSAGDFPSVALIVVREVASGGGGTTIDHISTLSFPALCRRPQNDNGRWIRSKGGLWQPRRAA